MGRSRTTAICLVALVGVASVISPIGNPSAAAAEPFLVFGDIHSVVEGGPGTTITVTVDLLLSEPSATESRWRWGTYNQPDWIDPDIRPSTPGADYVETGGVVTFAPGDTFETVSVTVLGDSLFESTEFIALVAAKDEVPIDPLTVAAGVAHILNDDAPPFVIPGSATIVEGAADPVLRVPVSLSTATGFDANVHWTTLNVPGAPPGQALSPADYTQSSGVVSFSSYYGETTKMVEIPIADDAIDEPGEYVVISFHTPTGAVMGGFWGLGFGGILDDD